jgi:hypothetical protein
MRQSRIKGFLDASGASRLQNTLMLLCSEGRVVRALIVTRYGSTPNIAGVPMPQPKAHKLLEHSSGPVVAPAAARPRSVTLSISGGSVRLSAKTPNSRETMWRS